MKRLPVAKRRHLFVSYARADVARVQEFLESLKLELRDRNLPVDIWQDIDQLHPGESWAHSIRQALADSIGLLVFVSANSMESGWVRSEIEAVLGERGRAIFPIILDDVSLVPPQLQRYQWIDLSTARGEPSEVRKAAARLAEGIARLGAQAPLTERMASRFAEFSAAAFRGPEAPAPAEAAAPVASSVFVVHGHDTRSRDMVCKALGALGIEPVLLSRERGSSQSLLQKFFRVAERANFAVAVLSPDDYGASLRQYNQQGVAERALKFRARQNVILELGFFYGRLGWENVFVLQAKPTTPYPDFEQPSDLAGAVFEEIDEAGSWKTELAIKLREAGFALQSADAGSPA